MAGCGCPRQAGADVNAQDASGQSAYLIAASEVGDYPGLLELTLAAGASVDARTAREGVMPLRHAELRGYDAIAAILRLANS